MSFYRPATVEVAKKDLLQLRKAAEDIENHLSKNWTPGVQEIASAAKRIKQQVDKLLGLDRKRHEIMD